MKEHLSQGHRRQLAPIHYSFDIVIQSQLLRHLAPVRATASRASRGDKPQRRRATQANMAWSIKSGIHETMVKPQCHDSTDWKYGDGEDEGYDHVVTRMSTLLYSVHQCVRASPRSQMAMIAPSFRRDRNALRGSCSQGLCNPICGY